MIIQQRNKYTKSQYVHRWIAGDGNVKIAIHHSNIIVIKIPEGSYCSKYDTEKKWTKNN